MKKKFENYQTTFGLFALFLFFLILSIYYLCSHFYKSYTLISAVIVDYHGIEVTINSEELDRLNKNKTIYMEGVLYKVKIKNIIRDIFIRDKISYHQVQLAIDFKKKYELLDVITIALYKEERPLITIFKSCWKGEKNAKVR